jgi:hypothetical protein
MRRSMLTWLAFWAGPKPTGSSRPHIRLWLALLTSPSSSSGCDPALQCRWVWGGGAFLYFSGCILGLGWCAFCHGWPVRWDSNA